MKVFIFALLLSAATAGLAIAGGGGSFHPHKYSSCRNNKSKQCVDARNAFAEHHNGMYPDQFYNQTYQGQRGRWTQHGKEWGWEGEDGDRYQKVHDKWQWVKHHDHGHDHH
jgi:hypothetical protein